MIKLWKVKAQILNSFLKKINVDLADIVQIFNLSRRMKQDISRGLPFSEEGAVVESLLSELGITEGTVVDLAASDGWSSSPTGRLISSGRFRGIAIEADAQKFARLSFIYRHFNVDLVSMWITPDNFCQTLVAHEIPAKFELLNLDIDGYDLDLMRSLLSFGFRPRLISMEINEKIPAGVYFEVRYRDGYEWIGDHFYGCSLESAHKLLADNQYSLIRLHQNNAMFIPNSLAVKFELENLSVEKALSEGYLGREERLETFSHNLNVDHWHQLSPEEAVGEIREYFGDYEGEFVLGAKSKD